MTHFSTTGPAAPPGWYVDSPADKPRYWDGRTWADPTPNSWSGPGRAVVTAAASPHTSWAQPGTPIDLAGAPLTFMAAVRSGFRNMLTFRGRASRSAYWWFWLFAMVMGFVGSLLLAFVVFSVNPAASEDAVAGIMLMGWLPFWIALLTLAGRRLHDSGLSAALLWLLLIPYLGGIALFFMLLRGPVEPNPYNPTA